MKNTIVELNDKSIAAVAGGNKCFCEDMYTSGFATYPHGTFGNIRRKETEGVDIENGGTDCDSECCGINNLIP